jgi:hypothetical protein
MEECVLDEASTYGRVISSYDITGLIATKLEGMECGRIEMKMGNVNSSSDQRKIPDRPKSEIRNGER